MNAKVLITFFITIAFSCNDTSSKLVDFEYFEIMLPNNWNYKTSDGVDSYVGVINANGYKIDFEYSSMGYANNLIESKQEYVDNNKEDWIPINLLSKNNIENHSLKIPCKENENIIKDYSLIKDSISKYNIHTDKDSIGYYAVLKRSNISKIIRIQFPCEIENHYFKIDTLNEYYRKVIYPKKTGNGMTGLYIKDLNSNLDFQISAKDLDEKTQKEFLQSLETIKLKHE